MKLKLYTCSGWHFLNPGSSSAAVVTDIPTIKFSQESAHKWIDDRLNAQLREYKELFQDCEFTVNYISSYDSTVRYGRIEVVGSGKGYVVRYTKVAEYIYRLDGKDLSALEILALEA